MIAEASALGRLHRPHAAGLPVEPIAELPKGLRVDFLTGGDVGVKLLQANGQTGIGAHCFAGGHTEPSCTTALCLKLTQDVGVAPGHR
ncbi:hypothetical protein ASF57_17425 [Methylobacterium sp. Leaf117]|nr:hypothetical protein ASF57_17425 [Methylobacterium sp. Leaf117]